MAQVKLTIDDKPVSAPEDATILEAARLADIYIPTLCHHPDLPPAKGKTPAEAVYHGQDKIENTSDQEHSGCGLCVVEIKRPGRARAGLRHPGAGGPGGCHRQLPI